MTPSDSSASGLSVLTSVDEPPRETGRLVESLPRSSDDNWRTPTWLLELIFPDGRFFDPCPINPTGLRAQDGRAAAWPVDVPVFLNPPYSDPAPWLRRAAEHPGPVVCLVRVDPSASWWSYSEGFKVTLIGQRLRFGRAKQVAPFASAIWRKA